LAALGLHTLGLHPLARVGKSSTLAVAHGGVEAARVQVHMHVDVITASPGGTGEQRRKHDR